MYRPSPLRITLSPSAHLLPGYCWDSALITRSISFFDHPSSLEPQLTQLSPTLQNTSSLFSKPSHNIFWDSCSIISQVYCFIIFIEQSMYLLASPGGLSALRNLTSPGTLIHLLVIYCLFQNITYSNPWKNLFS